MHDQPSGRTLMSDRAHLDVAAAAIAASVLGRDPGPLSLVGSLSHRVSVGADIVVKVIEVDRHDRLDREVALVSRLPEGLAPPLLRSGRYGSGAGQVRYACYARMPGTAPRMGLPGVDEPTARRLAEQAAERIGMLHAWRPPAAAGRILREPMDHGGFTGRDELLAGVERVAAGLGLPAPVLDRLWTIAERAPARAGTDVPVHADCHWDNWLTCDGRVSALLDFEWARYGDPVDDWFFLARFSGPHLHAVLDVLGRVTGTAVDALRTGCELREAAHLVADLAESLDRPDAAHPGSAGRLAELTELTAGHRWWP
ncbi:hypothetical protein Athai_20170 [Actinocatenispora thailandica]|uniref:Aminoglycoside phosphotransferase domain-containing protein n=1 Tax=Actinocatenispora thailandica TaxID=227318 RepID=A0A7R7DMP1_9ACTN|nr:aminoglycoside phosphotransferase family protein [Actinocatenispora thailandica]BCJ34514.1 hypothetical protein Athai_20170 [Actinocatenispora thailandica]